MRTASQIFFLVLSVISALELHDYSQGGANWGDECENDAQSPVNVIHFDTLYDAELQFAIDLHNNVTVEITDYIDTIKSFTTTIDHLNATNTQDQLFGFLPVNFHFHAPSEHQINGVSYDLEIHMVHEFDPRSSVVPPNRTKAAISILFKIDDTKPENPFINSLNLKHVSHTPQKVQISLHRDLWELFEMPLTFYNYDGSLTVPPCTESVEWYIMGQVQTLTLKQYLTFWFKWPGNPEFANGRGNNRDIQELNGRVVKMGITDNLLHYKGDPHLGFSAWAEVITMIFILLILIYKLIERKRSFHEVRADSENSIELMDVHNPE